MAASRGSILSLRAGENHSGFGSTMAREWKLAGGGALLRMGVHAVLLEPRRFVTGLRSTPPGELAPAAARVCGSGTLLQSRFRAAKRETVFV